MSTHRASRPRNRSQGFTLLELLLYIAIIGSLLTATVAFMGVVVDARVKSQSVSLVNLQGTAVMDYITQTIRNATSITSPTAGASGSSLTLVVPTGSLSPTIFDGSGGSPNVMRVKEGSGATVALTNDNVQVSNLTFKNVTVSGTSGAVQVSFTLSPVNPSNRNEYDYQQTFTSTAEIGW